MLKYNRPSILSNTSLVADMHYTFPVCKGRNLAIAKSIADIVNLNEHATATIRAIDCRFYTHELAMTGLNVEQAVFTAEQLHLFDSSHI